MLLKPYPPILLLMQNEKGNQKNKAILIDQAWMILHHKLYKYNTVSIIDIEHKITGLTLKPAN